MVGKWYVFHLFVLLAGKLTTAFFKSRATDNEMINVLNKVLHYP